MQIENKSRNTILVTRGRVAGTFLSRLRGLLGSPPLEKGEGLLLQNEKSIHSLFMTFAIDVIYINKAFEVIETDINMIPFRLGRYISDAAYILEVPVGTIQDSKTEIDDLLLFIYD